MDVVVVFKADSDGTLAMMSNFTKGKRGQELKERIKGSKIFQRLFKPPLVKSFNREPTSAETEGRVGCMPKWLLPTAIVSAGVLSAVLLNQS